MPSSARALAFVGTSGGRDSPCTLWCNHPFLSSSLWRATMREHVPHSGEAPRVHRRGTRQHREIGLETPVFFDEAFERAADMPGTTVASRTDETPTRRASTGRRRKRDAPLPSYSGGAHRRALKRTEPGAPAVPRVGSLFVADSIVLERVRRRDPGGTAFPPRIPRAHCCWAEFRPCGRSWPRQGSPQPCAR